MIIARMYLQIIVGNLYPIDVHLYTDYFQLEIKSNYSLDKLNLNEPAKCHQLIPL